MFLSDTCRRLVLAAALLPTLAAAAEGVPVVVAPVSELGVEDRQRAPGTVIPANNTVLAAQVAAAVQSVEVDVGMRVAKGDVLITLDPRDYELALAQREANIESLNAQIEQAEAQLTRVESLVEKNFASREDVQARATSLAVLRGQLAVEKVARRIARTDLERTRIVAPFDGDVVSRDAQLGGYVGVGAALLTLADSTGPEVEIQVHPLAISGLRQPGVSPVFSSYTRDYALRVARISPVVNPASQLQTVRLTFAGDEAPVGSGGSVLWSGDTGLLPARLVERRDGQLGVFTAEGNVARFVPLPDASEGRSARHALSPSTLIIVEGRTRLNDGDAISVTRQ